MEIIVVLVRPSIEGNVGAVARVMANFACGRLVLVDPRCDHLSSESRKRAKHAGGVLEGAVVMGSLSDVAADVLVATSAKLGSDYNVARIPLSPRELSGVVGSSSGVCALVFGPEDSGLSNDELEFCDVFVSIPAHDEYPVLNLSHSVVIILYELFGVKDFQERFAVISPRDKRALNTRLEQAVLSLDFLDEHKVHTQLVTWKRVLSKAFLSKREAFVVMGLFARVHKLSLKKGVCQCQCQEHESEDDCLDDSANNEKCRHS